MQAAITVLGALAGMAAAIVGIMSLLYILHGVLA
jgi:hypothetical protein